MERLSNPQLTASKIAIQNASVSDVLRKICPLTKVSLTLWFWMDPSNVIRLWSLKRSRTSSIQIRFGPSPAMKKIKKKSTDQLIWDFIKRTFEKYQLENPLEDICCKSRQLCQPVDQCLSYRPIDWQLQWLLRFKTRLNKFCFLWNIP